MRLLHVHNQDHVDVRALREQHILQGRTHPNDLRVDGASDRHARNPSDHHERRRHVRNRVHGHEGVRASRTNYVIDGINPAVRAWGVIPHPSRGGVVVGV